MIFSTTVLIIILVIALFALASSIRIVNQYEKGIIIRLGKYHATVSSGVAFLMPFIDSVIKVDMREKVINVEPQKVITKDNVLVTVDAVIYYKVVDPVKAEFEIEDFDYATTTLAQTNLRNLIGDKQLDETLTARDSINDNLRNVLDESTNAWAVRITKVELQKIDPPENITEAMTKQMRAEREKRAVILEAEGHAQSVLLKADAEAKAITMVAQAAEKNFTERAQKLKQLEVSAQVLAHNTKFVLPTSGDLVSVLNLEGSNSILPLKKK